MATQAFYIETLAGFTTRIDDLLVQPFIYQPTPRGVSRLCGHYSEKYNIDLQTFDLQGLIEQGDVGRQFFKYLSEHPELLEVEEGRRKGIVLTHGQHHAYPILLSKENDNLNIMVFDSSSGSRIRGYFGISELFPEANFYLNSGTRQADGQSCITDAICILKEALQLENLLTLIEEKAFDDHPSFHNKTRFICTEKPANFYLFKMPEQLLVTAQRSDYLSQADADLKVVIRGGETLEHYRNHFTIQARTYNREGLSEDKDINSYLWKKSKEHKEILDAIPQAQAESSSFVPIEAETKENSIREFLSR